MNFLRCGLLKVLDYNRLIYFERFDVRLFTIAVHGKYKDLTSPHSLMQVQYDQGEQLTSVRIQSHKYANRVSLLITYYQLDKFGANEVRTT